jgi:4-hydroxyproline epimerase
VQSVKITNVPAYLAARDVTIDVPGFGALSLDVAYGGNFYAIIEPQGPYEGLDALGASRLVTLSGIVRALVREKFEPVHPSDSTIRGVSHVLWADAPKGAGADARNAVFYGDRAIDRSPCGTGTSARMAQLAARGRLNEGERFVHESYIGSRFVGRVEERTTLAGQAAIIPSIEGAALATGFNTIWVDREDALWRGFQVT